jgi:hypothetical protein
LVSARDSGIVPTIGQRLVEVFFILRLYTQAVNRAFWVSLLLHAISQGIQQRADVTVTASFDRKSP